MKVELCGWNKFRVKVSDCNISTTLRNNKKNCTLRHSHIKGFLSLVFTDGIDAKTNLMSKFATFLQIFEFQNCINKKGRKRNCYLEINQCKNMMDKVRYI